MRNGIVKDLFNSLVGLEHGLLRNVTNRLPIHLNALAVEFVIGAGKYAQQSRFARTVSANHSDLGTSIKRQCNVMQYLSPVIKLIQIYNLQSEFFSVFRHDCHIF